MSNIIKGVTAQFTAPVQPTTFGGSSWLTTTEAAQLRLNKAMDDDKGPVSVRPYVGVLVDETRMNPLPMPIFAAKGGHLCDIAPTRAGKGVSKIIPVCLSWPHSLVVLDVKGENYARTAGFRARTLKQEVIRFSPFERHTHRLNPLMCVRVDDEAEAEEDADFLADLVCVPSGDGENAFFHHWAKEVVSALILHVRTVPLNADPADKSDAAQGAVRERSMAEVNRLVKLGTRAFDGLLLRMSESPFATVRETATSLRRLTGGADNRTGISILATAQQHMRIWGRIRVRRATYIPGMAGSPEPGANEINFAALREGRSTVYLVVPPDELDSYRGVLRVLTGLVVRAMRMTQRQAVGRPPVLMMLDEFPQLGHMAPIEQSLLYMAGYGLIYWFFVQSLTDLERYYPKSYRNFLANCSTLSFYSVSDQETANYVSELCGMTTVPNEGFSTAMQDGTSGSTTTGNGTASGPGGSSTNESTSSTEGWSQSVTLGRSLSYVGRRLILPDEVRTLSEHAQIIFMRNTVPILAHKPPYHGITKYREASAIPPPQEIGWST